MNNGKTFLILFLILFTGLATAQNETKASNTVQTIDDTIRVTDYNLELDSENYIVVDAETSGTLSITDINGIEDQGTGTFNFKNVHYSVGKTNISVEATSDLGDKTVTVTKDNIGIYLSNDRTSDFIGSPDGWQFTLGALGGGTSIILLIVVLVKHKKWKFNKRPLRVI